jgi:hypothetical protein
MIFAYIVLGIVVLVLLQMQFDLLSLFRIWDDLDTERKAKRIVAEARREAAEREKR